MLVPLHSRIPDRHRGGWARGHGRGRAGQWFFFGAINLGEKGEGLNKDIGGGGDGEVATTLSPDL